MKSSFDFVLYLLAIAVIIGGAFGVYDAVVCPTVTRPGTGVAPDTAEPWYRPSHLPTGRILRVVIIGADDRDGEVGRSDTLMVASINPSLKKVAFLSIPRDLRVHIPGHGLDKINAAFAEGGHELTIATVRELLDEDTDYYVKVNFEGFVKVVDTLGGVDITVPDIEGPRTNGVHRGINYDDNWGNLHIALKPGRQHLNGKQALGFVRYRKSNVYRTRSGAKYRVEIGDLERAANQQMFIREIVRQKLRVSQSWRLLKAGSQIMKYVETDIGWLEAVDIFNIIRGVTPSEIYCATVPMGGRMRNGIWYGELHERAFHKELSTIQDHLYGRVRTDCPVAVYNGCGKAGIASQAAGVLRQYGFEDVTTDNAQDFGHKRTSIEYHGDTRAIAKRAADAMGCGKIVAGNGEEEQSRLEITIGDDFQPSG